tara:strand:+ start:1209 stop:1430 length:222 start_codon:yes stop_codon:yes gene_type:complete
MKFKNNTGDDVYVDLGTLHRVPPGQEVNLPGAIRVPGLTPVHEPIPAKPKGVKKAAPQKHVKSTKNVDTSGTI